MKTNNQNKFYTILNEDSSINKKTQEEAFHKYAYEKIVQNRQKDDKKIELEE